MQAADMNHAYPHVAIRELNGLTEACIPGTGLAVWELAWIARLHDDVGATAEHLGQSRELIEEALRYARDHSAETDEEIKFHTERSLEDLLEILPGMRVIDIELSEQQHLA
jgi:uncharacterized protein (DUF433 family)